MPDIDWNSLKTAYAAGVGLRELARATGISEGTVTARAYHEKWSEQVAAAKALVKREGDGQAMAVKGTSAVISALQKHGDKSKLRLAKGISKGALTVSRMTGEAIVERADRVKSLVDSASKLHGWGQDSEKSGALVNVNVLGLVPDGFT